jgi:hypothetical protein
MTTIDPKLLARAWVHAPPSRGRRIIDLSQAEKLTVTKPDASDRPTSHEAHWKLVDDQLSFSYATHEHGYRIESLSDHELVLKRLQ